MRLVEVGDQQDAGAALADLGDPADQALAGDRRLALGDALLGADRGQDRAHERAAGIADHPAGDRAGLGICRKIEQAAQRLVLAVEPARRLLPVLEPADLLAQRPVLLVDMGDLADLGECRGHRLGGLADDTEHRGQDVEQRHAGPLDHDHLGLAEQHQAERHRDQRQKTQNAPSPP